MSTFPPEERTPNDRLIALETAIAHLQHQLEQLHEVVLAQRADIAALRRELERTGGKLDRLSDPPESPDPLQDRPPHY